MSLQLVVRRSLSMLSASLLLAACGGTEMDVEALPDAPAQEAQSELQSQDPSNAAAECFFYRCPRTGRIYGGISDYSAEHRCELNCGDFCTFERNDCI